MGTGWGGGCLKAQVCGQEAGSARLAPRGCCLPALLPQCLSFHGSVLPECPWLGPGGQRLSSQGQQWAPDQPARDKGLSEHGRGLCPWAGLGAAWEEPGGGCGPGN